MLSLPSCSLIPSNIDLVKSYRNDLLPDKSYVWYKSSSKARLLKVSVYNSYTVFLRRLLESKRGQVNSLGDSGTDASKKEQVYGHGLQSKQMIEFKRAAMTGSNNSNPDNLTWLTNVTTAGSREVVKHGTMERLSASTLQSPESLLCSSNLFHRAAANTASAGHQQHYVAEYQTTFPVVEGNSVPSFHRQTPYLAQTYASIYHPHYASSPTETASLIMPGRQSFHAEPYSYLSDLPSSAPHQLQLPHSLAFLAVTAPKASSQQTSPVYSLYPTSDESKERSSGRILLPSSVSSPKEDKHSSESTLVDVSAKVPDLSKAMQNEQTPPYFFVMQTKEKGKLTKEQASSPPYRVPAGKEGSLKHRILRPPPSIDIYQPSVSDTDSAPLSAPLTTYEHPGELTSVKHATVLTKDDPTSSLSMQKSEGFPRTPQHHRHPAYFMKGSIIQLANGRLKCVEDLQTSDFVESAESSTDLSVDYSTIIRIEEVPGSGLAILGFSVGEKQVQITAEAPLEHPFFIWNQGWSSCSPELSMHRYNLSCCKLRVGDVCISLTHKVRKNSRTSPKLTQSSSNVTFAIQDTSAKCSTVKSNTKECSDLRKCQQSHSSIVSSQMSHLQCSEKSMPKRKRKRCSSAPDSILSES